MYIQTYDLDLLHGGVPLIVPVSQKDVGSTLAFNLYFNGTKFIPSQTPTARIEGGKPDGTYFSNSMVYSSGTASVTVTKQMTAVAGKVNCEIRLTQGERDIGTANFILDVEETPFPEGAIESETDISALTTLMMQAAQNANKAETAANSMVYKTSGISSLDSQTLWRSIYSGVTNMTIAIGFYYNANKTDSFTGDAGGYHLVVIIKPSSGNDQYGKIIVFTNDTTVIHVGRVLNNVVTWDK